MIEIGIWVGMDLIALCVEGRLRSPLRHGAYSSVHLNPVTDVQDPTGRCYRSHEDRQYDKSFHCVFLREKGLTTVPVEVEMASSLTPLAA